MRMVEQLVRLAEIWSATNDRSLSRLATRVINRGHFFEQPLDQMNRAGLHTFEKFLTFFRDGGNWAGGLIPAAAVDLLDNFENIAVEAGASTVKGDADSSDDRVVTAAADRDAAPRHARDAA